MGNFGQSRGLIVSTGDDTDVPGVPSGDEQVASGAGDSLVLTCPCQHCGEGRGGEGTGGSGPRAAAGLLATAEGGSAVFGALVGVPVKTAACRLGLASL